MKNISKNIILEKITDFYMSSKGFNGISGANLIATCKIKWDNKLHDVLSELIEDDLIGILYSDLDINTHILRTGFPPKDLQITKLNTNDLFHTCIYPRSKYLETIIDHTHYDKTPYNLCLALGEPQLAYRSFDLSILESYRNDPRYFYKTDDIEGHIILQDKYMESTQIEEHHKVLLSSFGFSYDSNMNRAVAVYLRYLTSLSPEHQQIWKAKELIGYYQLHPDYYNRTVLESFGGGVSIFTAFHKELYLINQMTKAMGRPSLFRKDLGKYGEDKPPKLGFLVRPTLEEFNSFVLLLDKLLSDNINKDFFCNEVPYETEIKRKDDKIQVQNKGTLQILDEWIRNYFCTENWEPWTEAINTLRKVRKLRQQPAHAINENIFDQHYFKEQRDLIINVYSAVRTLRLMLANHPNVIEANIEIPNYILNSRIWTY